MFWVKCTWGSRKFARQSHCEFSKSKLRARSVYAFHKDSCICIIWDYTDSWTIWAQLRLTLRIALLLSPLDMIFEWFYGCLERFSNMFHVTSFERASSRVFLSYLYNLLEDGTNTRDVWSKLWYGIIDYVHVYTESMHLMQQLQRCNSFLSFVMVVKGGIGFKWDLQLGIFASRLTSKCKCRFPTRCTICKWNTNVWKTKEKAFSAPHVARSFNLKQIWKFGTLVNVARISLCLLLKVLCQVGNIFITVRPDIIIYSDVFGNRGSTNSL